MGIGNDAVGVIYRKVVNREDIPTQVKTGIMVVCQFRVELVLRDTRQHISFSRPCLDGKAVELEVGIRVRRGQLQSFHNVNDDGNLDAVAVGVGISKKCTVADIGDADYLVFNFHNVPCDIEINTLPNQAPGADLKTVGIPGRPRRRTRQDFTLRLRAGFASSVKVGVSNAVA